MLENALVNKNKSVNYKDMSKQLEDNLCTLQQKIKEKKLPVIILLEGWGAWEKDSLFPI